MAVKAGILPAVPVDGIPRRAFHGGTARGSMVHLRVHRGQAREGPIVESERAGLGIWPCLCLAVVAMLGPALFWQGGTMEREATVFIPQYAGDRPLLQKVFDPHANDFGTYQARELSYFFDALDALIYIHVVAPIEPAFFVPASSIVASLLLVLVFARGVRRTAGRIDALTGSLVLACFLGSFVFLSTMGLFYRSGKAFLCVAVLAFLFHVREVAQRRSAAAQSSTRFATRDALVAFLLLLFAGLLDRQGAFYVLVACAVLLVHLARTRALRDLFAASCLAALALHAYNIWLAPLIIHRLNGYWPSFEYQHVPLDNVSSTVLPALHLLAGNVSAMLGGYWPVTVAWLGAMGTLLVRPRGGQIPPATPAAVQAAPPSGRPILPSAGVLLVAHVAMYSLMIARHRYVYDWIDHRRWYLPLPWLAVVLLGVVIAVDAALARLAGRGRRLLQLALAALVIGNLVGLADARRVMVGGPWFARIHQQSDWLKSSLHGGPERSGLEPWFTKFLEFVESRTGAAAPK